MLFQPTLLPMLVMAIVGIIVVLCLRTRNLSLHVLALIGIQSGLITIIWMNMPRSPHEGSLLFIALLLIGVLILLVHGFQLRDTRQLSGQVIARVSALDHRMDAFLDALERRAELLDRRLGHARDASTHELSSPASTENRAASGS
jgi:hypothetical protein